MTVKQHYEIAIVGMGPAGAVAAALFGQQGRRVLIVDKSLSPYNKPRAVGMDHEIMRALQGIGVAEQIAPMTAPFTLSEHYGADGQLIRRVGMLPPPYPMGWTPTMTFLQPRMEEIVRDRVSRLPNVDVRRGVELISLRQNAESVGLALRSTDGQEESVQAAYVVGCDGASSSVRSLLGVAIEDLDFDEPWLVVDLIANDRGLAKLPKVSTHFCEPDRPTMFVACTDRHRRFEMMLRPGEDPREMEREDKVWSLMSRWINREDAVLWRRASYRFHALIAKQWRQGRVFLAGDAAHQQPPFLGQGMCQGVRDVTNLAWKLDDVMAGRAGASLLDTYHEERSAHVKELIDIIKRIGRYICELNPVAARQRDARLLEAANGEVPTLVRQELMPTLRSGWMSRRPHPAHGTLFPQPKVLTGSGSVRLLDDVAGAGWRLVLGPAAFDWSLELPQNMRLLKVAHDTQDDAWQETDGVVARWWQQQGCRAAIVRPDHYVYAVAGSESELQAELQGLAARCGQGDEAAAGVTRRQR